MQAYPQPPLTPFQVTLLPEQVHASSSSSGPSSSASANAAASSVYRALEASRTENWATAASMLHGILELASDYRKPQIKFAAYSPEKVLRSVRGIVDDDHCKELLGLVQEAVRDYTERALASITELRRQRQSTDGVVLAPSQHTARQTAKTAPADSAEEDSETLPEDAASTLDAVQTLAILVTYYERLHHGIAELSSVWMHATQWCTMHASREIPRSLSAASTQESSTVFNSAPELFETALKGFCAVLKAELSADTATLATPAPTTPAFPMTNEMALLRSPASAADAKMDASALELLACPPSLEHLTTPLRRRLLFLFTQMTRGSQQYNTQVEPVAVQIVRHHFESVAHRWWAEELSARNYFELSEAALKHAETIYEQFLHSGTIPLVEDAIQTTLIGNVGAEVLKRDFTALMEQEQFHTLRLAWRLLSSSAHVRSAPVVVTQFREYLLECGHGIMEEVVVGSTKVTPAGAQAAATVRERPFLAVRHLIGLLEQGNHTVEKCFHECEKEFKVALHEALQTILEAYPNAFSEQLAAYQDALMKEVELGHVPISLSGAAAAPPSPSQNAVPEDQRTNDGEGEEAGDGRSPLRRPRAESTAPPTASPPTAGGTWKEAVLGSAALRHATPLPAEAKEATPVLRRIAYVYSYHPKKDLFEAAYWRDFARRCLHPHRKVDAAAENAFILYLRDICGLSFTAKFEGMLTDLESSSQLTSQYKAWCAEQTPSSDALAAEEDVTAGQRRRETPSPGGSTAVETHLLILTQSFWPKYAPQPPQLYVPPPLQRVTTAVAQFYAGLFPNRHLTWQHPLANATLRAQLTPQSPVLSLTGTYTQCILLMRLDALHDKGVAAVTVRALCEEVGLDSKNTEVMWSLQGLCHPRFRLVLCEAASGPAQVAAPASTAAGKDAEEEECCAGRRNASGDDDARASPTSTLGQFAPSDVVRLNLAFTSNTAKVRIPLQTRARTTATLGVDGSGRGARTADNGGHLVEVAIVSCLKARRTISHADLAAEVNARLPFAVSVPMLKKSVEKMIERGFMVRGKDGAYNFSA